MTEATWIALIGVSGTVLAGVLGALIPLLGQRAQRKHEREQWYAEFFLKLKIDALMEIKTACIDLLESLVTTPSSSFATRDGATKVCSELIERRQLYHRLCITSGTYFPGPPKILSELSNHAQAIVLKLETNLTTKTTGPYYDIEQWKTDRERSTSLGTQATALLDGVLNPTVLKRLLPLQ